MSSKKKARRRDAESSAAFSEARDELFHHIMQCGVIGSDPEHQSEWFGSTMDYMKERFHELDEQDLAELRVLGERFCAPPKSYGKEPDAVSAA